MSRAIPPLVFREAWQFWRDKVTVTPADFRALADQYRVRAFTVSGVQKLEQLREMQDSVESAIVHGQGFRRWQRRAGRVLRQAGWSGDTRPRLQTIFRNNIQTAYMAGRWEQQQRVQETRPYLMYDAILDDRVRPSHAAQDGKVYRSDSDYWTRWYPPNGHRCRCRAIAMTAEQVREEGLSILESPDSGQFAPDIGWASNPGRAPFRAPLGRYTPDLREAFLRDALTQPPHIMQRFLHPADRASFQTLRWADETTRATSFADWARTMRRTQRPQGQIHAFEQIPGSILGRLPYARRTRLALAVVRGRAMRAGFRNVRTVEGTAMTDAEVERLPALFRSRSTRWYVDRRDNERLIAEAVFRGGVLLFHVRRNSTFGIGRGARAVANEVTRIEYRQSADIPMAFREVRRRSSRETP